MIPRNLLTIFVALLTYALQSRCLLLPAQATGSIRNVTQNSGRIAPYGNRTETTYYPPARSLLNLKPDTTGVMLTTIFKFEQMRNKLTITQVIVTSLETEGNPSRLPFPTPYIPALTIQTHTQTNEYPVNNQSSSNGAAYLAAYNSTLPIRSFESAHGRRAHAHAKMEARAATDCFRPLASNSIPSEIPSRSDHPAPKLGIVRRQSGPSLM